GHVLEKWVLQVVPLGHRATLLVVAETGVDHDALRRRLRHQRMDRHSQPPFFRGVARNQPRQLQDLLAPGFWQDEPRTADGLDLDDPRDPDPTDRPLHLALLSCRPSYFGRTHSVVSPLPPPLRGRVGEGGPQAKTLRVAPLPRPSPQGGGEQRS